MPVKEKIIIAIHGLANKPPEEELRNGWKSSIDEGLAHLEKGPYKPYIFELVYWAKYLYANPLHRMDHFDFDPLYNKQPYKEAEPGAIQRYNDRFLDEVRGVVGDFIDNGLDWVRENLGVTGLGDFLLRNKIKDLQYYWDTSRQLMDDDKVKKPAAEVLQGSLRRAILKYADANKYEIMIIAHSMGTIISYDVLRDLGKEFENLTVPYYITIGSPLGLPLIKSKIKRDRWDNKVRTPTAVTKGWLNFSDKRDPVAIDSHLRDDYGMNKHKVQVEDDLVSNDYPGNHHKSYGYLRTPELSKAVAAFLRS